MRKGRVLVAAAALCLAAGCRRIPESATTSGATSQKAGQVVVYCSTDKEFAEPVFQAFEHKTGTKVLPVYDTEETKTAGLTARLVAEAAHPKADVFWSSDTSRAVALVQKGLAAPYASPSAAAIPPAYRDPQSRWTGFAARIRVILYNTERVKPEQAPKSILDFTRPAWKGRFAIPNPHFGTMSFQAAALFVKWGEGKATEFFRALKENGVVIAAGNSDVKDRVSDGRVAAGIVDEDDAVVALREKKPVAIVIPDQEGGDALGTPVMPNTAMEVRAPPIRRKRGDFSIFSCPRRRSLSSRGATPRSFPSIRGSPALQLFRPWRRSGRWKSTTKPSPDNCSPWTRT